MSLVVRKQRPPVLTDYRKYKRYLRLDFERRCAYCHIPESRYGTPGNYAVDHFRPKSRPEFKYLICRYSNLLYACRDCNGFKGATWPHAKLTRLGFRFLNPCREDMSAQWTAAEGGRLVPKTRAAEYMIARLQLNRQFLCDWRREKRELRWRIEDVGATVSMARKDRELVDALRRILMRLERQLAEEYGSYWA